MCVSNSFVQPLNLYPRKKILIAYTNVRLDSKLSNHDCWKKGVRDLGLHSTIKIPTFIALP